MSELHILQHSLGVDQFGRGRQYRNHFVTGPGSVDFPHCMALIEKGLMVRREGGTLTGGDYVFYVTDEGRRWMAENSPAPPKLTRGQQRYADYLAADCDLSFGDWVKRQARAPAPPQVADITEDDIPF